MHWLILDIAYTYGHTFDDCLAALKRIIAINPGKDCGIYLIWLEDLAAKAKDMGWTVNKLIDKIREPALGIPGQYEKIYPYGI